MPVPITRYNVLLSSPGDAQPLAEIAAEVLESINRTHSESTGIELCPTHWSRDSSADSGAEPQALLNKQIVDSADIVLAIFKERFGTPTQNYSSGTEEEIRLGLKDGKRVMLYFWNPPAGHAPSAGAQPDKISAFRDSLGKSTLYKLFSDEAEFKKHITHDFTSLVFKLEGARERPLPSLSIASADRDNKLHDGGLTVTSNLARQTLNAGFLDDAIESAYQSVKASPVRKPKPKPLPPKSEEISPAPEASTPATSAVPAPVTAFGSVKIPASTTLSTALEGIKLPDNMAKNALQNTALTEMSKSFAKQYPSLFAHSLGEPVRFPEQDIAIVSDQLEQLGLEFDEDLLYLGALSRSTLGSAALAYKSTPLQGTDEEKEKHKAASKLVSLCKQRHEFRSFLDAYEGIGGATLVLRNNGSAPATHVRVEIRVPSASFVDYRKAPLPGDYFIGHALDADDMLSAFVGYMFEAEECASYRGYDDSRVRSESGSRFAPLSISRTLPNDPFGRRLLDGDDFASSIDWLYGDFNVVDDFAKGEKVVSVGFDRVQHNSAYGFPARILLRTDVRTTIRYRITADELPASIEGELSTV